jgi:FixJ family two-component response regulator
MNATGLVLLVIEDALIRRDVQRICRSAGHQVTCYPDAAAYLAARSDSLGIDPDSDTDTPNGCLVLDIADADRLELVDQVAGNTNPLLRQPVIVVGSELDCETIVQLLRRGAMDVMGHPLDGGRLLHSVRRAQYQARRAHGLRRRVRRYESNIRSLTQREHQTLGHLLHGWSNKEIASRMKVSEKTVASHRASLLRKMRTGHLVELVRLHTEVTLVMDSPTEPCDTARNTE